MYQQIYAALKLNPRTIQWYATEGLIPKPTKIGTEAYYSDSAQIFARLQALLIFQRRHELKLKEIKEIVENQEGQSWEDILSLLQALEDTFSRYDIDKFGNQRLNHTNERIAKIVLNQLKMGDCPGEISLVEAEEKAHRKPKPSELSEWDGSF